MDERFEYSASQKARYWQKIGLSAREGFKMHQVSGQLAKGEDSWRNVAEHCLVQVARVETLRRLMRLPDTLIDEMKMGVVLHDFYKKQEISATRQANRAGNSPLTAVRSERRKGENLLRDAGFSDRVIRLASSAGGDAPQLIEAQRILDQDILSDDDWAYLIVHYVDDCSNGADWVRPSQVGTNGSRVNVVDYRIEEDRGKKDYQTISWEITEELASHSRFGGMDSLIVAVSVSHQIELRLAKEIAKKTGEDIDSLIIPELVDLKIKEAIEKYP